MNRIICIGNRFLDHDAAGPKVFDALSRERLPEGVDIVDGGTAGLNLLGLVDGVERVVFVDAVNGFLPHGGVTVMKPHEVPPPAAVYDHGAGLPYLLSVIPQTCDRAPGSIFLVGIEGAADAGVIAEAAAASLRLACSAGAAVAGAGVKP